MTAGKTTAQVFGLFGLLATAISLGFTAADVAAQEVAPKVTTAGGRRFTPKTAPTATKRQARVTEARADACRFNALMRKPLPAEQQRPTQTARDAARTCVRYPDDPPPIVFTMGSNAVETGRNMSRRKNSRAGSQAPSQKLPANARRPASVILMRVTSAARSDQQACYLVSGFLSTGVFCAA